MTQENIDTWAKEVDLINCYGPSETSNYVSTTPVCLTQPTNFGRGDGLKLWLVDIHNDTRLAPIGCIGELYVEGQTLSRGYLNDSEKTEESFVINPQWMDNLKGEAKDCTKPRRAYRTGDLVRYNMNGSLSYVGRKDWQVKIRGQRLELSEVEYHLRSIQDVKHGSVHYPKSGPCFQKLVAVITLHELSNIDNPTVLKIVLSTYSNNDRISKIISEIHSSLSDKVPTWMVPSVWIVIEEAPLSPSMKLDKSRVEKWLTMMSDGTYETISRFSIESSIALPTAPLEREIQEVWSEVLNLPENRVGVQTSFLRLGGDSINAMQVIAKCRNQNIAISVADILRGLTISQLAVRAQSLQIKRINAHEECNTDFQLSPIQRMHLNRGPAGDKFSQTALLKMKEVVPTHRLRDALELLVERHSMLRAKFTHLDDGEWSQMIRPYSRGLFLYGSSEVASPAEIGTEVSEIRQSLDFCGGPVFAAHLFNTASDGPIVFLIAHHLVVDSVSWRIMLSDLEEYIRQGNITAPKPLPFQTWSRMQIEFAKSISPAKSLSFKAAPPDYAYWGMENRPNLVGDTVSRTFSLSPATTALLVDECNRSMKTDLIELLLSAISYSFAQVFVDRTTPAVYSEGHGRETWNDSIDISETVGWFTTIYPIAIPVQTTIADTVKMSKDIKHTIPRNGWDFFTSYVLTSEGNDKFTNYFPCEILLNFLGSYQQLEREKGLFSLVSAEIPGLGAASPQMSRFELFGIEALIDKGSLRFDVSYNAYMKHQDLIQVWIREIEHVLNQMTTELVSLERQFTLADFQLLPSMSYADLEKLTNKILPQIGVDDIGNIEDIYPCTPIQEGILVAQTKSPHNYNVQGISRVSPGPGEQRIDTQRLRDSWQMIVNRHSILRTIFIEGLSSNDGLFQQLVLKSSKAAIFHLECNDEDEALRLLQRYPSVDFTTRQPSHRFGICQILSSGTVFLKLEISHALIDAVSTQLILKDLIQAYSDILPSTPGPLYSEYVSYIQQQTPNASLEFWKEALATMEPCHFPAIGGESQQTRPKEAKRVKVPFVDADAVHSFCEEQALTPAILLQVVWSFVIRTYTQKDSVCFGYVSAGRDVPIPEIENAIGPFINMLVSHTKFAPMASLISVLRSIQTSFVDSLPHQICSLASVQHELSPGGAPLFNTTMSIQRGSNSVCSDSNKVGIKIDVIDGQDPTEVFTF